jgi:opacity protein-like surface antigen
MRWVVGALIVVAVSNGARAADYDILRGSQPVGPATFTRWAGFYGGGQIGYSSASADFSQASQSLLAYSLRESALENNAQPSDWPVLGETATATTQNYGGFVGYNTQWQDLILGVELNYTRTNVTLVAPVSPISRVVPDGIGNTDAVTVTGSASMRIIDYGQVRGRAGWVFGNILPYGFGGFVVGRADIDRSATVFGTQTNDTTGLVTPFSFTNSESNPSTFIYGFSAGGGVDVALTPNIFVRGEFEYLQFARTSEIVASVMSGRLAAGFKF